MPLKQPPSYFSPFHYTPPPPPNGPAIKTSAQTHASVTMNSFRCWLFLSDRGTSISYEPPPGFGGQDPHLKEPIEDVAEDEK